MILLNFHNYIFLFKVFIISLVFCLSNPPGLFACQEKYSIFFLKKEAGWWSVKEFFLKNGSIKKNNSIENVFYFTLYKNTNISIADFSKKKISILNDTGRDEITIAPESSMLTDFSFSPNGTLAYSSSIAGSIDAHDIWSYDPNIGKVTQLTRMAKMQHQPSWCDDRQLVFVSSTSEQSHDLWRLDVPTNSLHQLTAGQLYNFEPSCSVANGIVFSSNRSGDYEIWSTDLEGKHFVQLTNSPGLDGQPAWSPDGSQIAFISNRTGYPAVWVMNRDGSNQHQVSPEGMICRNPVWGISEP